jgi:hypothetical protein
MTSDQGQTRRRFLRSGAGAAAGLALSGLGAPATAGADPGDPVRELRYFAGGYVPEGWTRFGDGRGRALLGAGEVPGGPTRRPGDSGRALARGGNGDQPVTLGLTCIRHDGINNGAPSPDPLVGEVRAFAFDTKLPNWLPCDGSEVRINTYPALFSVVDLAFGGDGKQSFRLPDLRGRVPLGSGDPEGLPAVGVGERGDGILTGGDGRRVRFHLNFRIAFRGDYPTRPER